MTRNKIAWSTGLLVSALVSGCAAPASKQGATEIRLNLSGAHFCGGATTTVTITTTPTSESRQDARTDTKVDATIPVR